MEVIGREWEQERVDGFLDMIAEGSAALVLEGEPGIGKTTVWRAVVDAARRRSYRVLVCRTSESESALSFLGLGDLLESMSDAMFDALPEPQRRALQFALLRSSGEGSPDRVAVARGTLAVLRAAASEAPTLVAIDDAHWLDSPSADVAPLRRASADRGAPRDARVGAERRRAARWSSTAASPRTGVTRLRLQALTFEELQDVVRAHLPVSLPQPTWRVLYRISAGNPFFALQLAEALEARGGRAPGEGLPIPETLADAMRERLAALSPGARAALLPIAALAQPTLSLLREAAIERDGVQEAVQAGVLVVDGERVRFTHPLLGSLVYGDASDAERRDVHMLLAPLVAEREEHALHLARGTLEPDEDRRLHARGDRRPRGEAWTPRGRGRTRRARSPSDRGGAAGRSRATRAGGGAVPHRGRGRSPVSRAARGAGRAASGLGGARTGAEPPRVHSERHVPLDSAARRCSRRGGRGSRAALADPLFPVLEGGDA